MLDLINNISANTIASVLLLAIGIALNAVARGKTHGKTRATLLAVAELIQGASTTCPNCGQEKPKCPCRENTSPRHAAS